MSIPQEKTMSRDKLRVAVCICTLNRPELLRKLLMAIGKLSFCKSPIPETTIVVVDNDELASAKKVCESSNSVWPIRYVVETSRGITYARNRAIVEAKLVDFIAFIDDDEIPSSQWLDELLWTRAQFGADVVSGPVSPQYAPEIAAWVKQGGFFERGIGPTGTIREACATNNVLIGTHVFKTVPGFDHAFALSGAEDTHFSLRIRQAGFKIVWSEEAIVTELLPPERGKAAWILRRDYQTGNGWVFCETGLDSRWHIRIVRFCKALVHVVMGLLTAVWASIRFDRAALIHSLRRASLGVGMLSALAGYRFLAYRGAEEITMPDKLHAPAK